MYVGESLIVGEKEKGGGGVCVGGGGGGSSVDMSKESSILLVMDTADYNIKLYIEVSMVGSWYCTTV